MGGPGSGRWYRWGTRETVEGCLRIDVRDWQRRGFLRPGTAFVWSWYQGRSRVASIDVAALDGAVELSYTCRHGAGEAQAVRYRVPLTWTPCHYGGRRPWFVCPGRGCGRRAAVLYLHGRYFLCRRCHGLVYESQREDRAHRLMHKAQKIHRRLGGSGSLLEPLPPKPKRMRWRTYERLCQEAMEADLASCLAMEEWLAAQQARLERLAARTGRDGAL